MQEGYDKIDDVRPQKTQHKSDVTKDDGNECYQIQLESGMFKKKYTYIHTLTSNGTKTLLNFIYFFKIR